MGYREEHIAHHIRQSNGLGQPSREVCGAVDKQLAQLSRKRALLPWNASSRGKKKGGLGK
jgi:hypothetical protein